MRSDAKDLERAPRDSSSSQLDLRRPFQPTIVVLVNDADHERHIRHLFDKLAKLRTCRSSAELKSYVREHRADAIVLSLRSPQTASAVHDLERFWGEYASIPLVVYTEIEPSQVNLVLAAGRYGFSYVIIHEMTFDEGLMRSIVQHAQSHPLLAALKSDIDLLTSGYTQQFCRYVFAHACEPISVEHVVRALKATRQHVAREFAHEGLHRPKWYLTTAQLAMAVKMLAHPEVTIERAARAMHFSGPASLRKALQRHFGMSCSDARHPDAFDHAVNIIRDSLSKQQEESSDRAA